MERSRRARRIQPVLAMSGVPSLMTRCEGDLMGDEAKIVDADGAARCVMAVRRMMKETITADVVLNPAVDMLFALYLNRKTSAWIPRQEVCQATGAGEDVCRRWGLALQERGLVAIDDQRYCLTEQGEAVMSRVNDQVWQIAAQHMSADLQRPEVR